MIVKICKRGPTNVNGSHFNVIDTHSRGSDPEGSAARYYILQGRRHKLKFLDRTPEEEAQEIFVRVTLVFADDLQPVPSAGSNAEEGPLINFGRGSQSGKACTEITGVVKDKSGETDFTFGVASLSYFWSRRWFKLKVEYGPDNLQPKEGIHIYVVTHARLLDLHASNRTVSDQAFEEGGDEGSTDAAAPPRSRGVKRELAKLMSSDYPTEGEGSGGHAQGIDQPGVDMTHGGMMPMAGRMMPGGGPDDSGGYYAGGSSGPIGISRPPKRPRAEDLLSEAAGGWRPPPFGQSFMQQPSAGTMPGYAYGQYFAPVPPQQGYFQGYSGAGPPPAAGPFVSSTHPAVMGMMGLASGGSGAPPLPGGRNTPSHLQQHMHGGGRGLSPGPVYPSYPSSPGIPAHDVHADPGARSSTSSPQPHGARRPDAVAQLLDFQDPPHPSQSSFTARAAAAGTASRRPSIGGAVSPANPQLGSGSTPPQAARTTAKPSGVGAAGTQAPPVHVVPTSAELKDIASLCEAIAESGEVPGLDGGEAYLAELRKRAAAVEAAIADEREGGEAPPASGEAAEAGSLGRRPLRPVAYVPVFDSPRLSPPFLVTDGEAGEISARLERLHGESNWDELAIGLSVPTVLHTPLFRERAGRTRLASLLRAVRAYSASPSAAGPPSPAKSSGASGASSGSGGVLTAASVGVTGIAKGLYLALLQVPFDLDSRPDAHRVVEAVCHYAIVFSSERRLSSPDLFEAPWADVAPLFAKARAIAAKAFGEVSYVHTFVMTRQADAMMRYGRLKEALAHYLKAWSQTPRLPGSGHGASASQHLVTELHRNLAECYAMLGQMEGWDQTLVEALEVKGSKEEDRFLEASVNCARGVLALYSQRLDRARSIFDALLTSSQSLPAHYRLDRAWFLALRTLACLLQGDVAAAAESWRQTVELIAHVGDFGHPDSDVVGALLLFVRNAPFEPAVREAARWSVAWALALLSRAADRLGETPTEALALYHLAGIFADRGRWALAAAAGREAQQGLARFRGHFAGKSAFHERLQTCLDTCTRRLREDARAAAAGAQTATADSEAGAGSRCGSGPEHAAPPLAGVTVTVRPREAFAGSGAGVMGPPQPPFVEHAGGALRSRGPP